MTVVSERVLRLSRHFNASPERVFDAWLDPKTAGQWLFTTATAEMRRVEIDPRVGGKYLFVDRRNGNDIEHVGEYLEIDRPRKLVFTFGVPKISPEFTRVSIDIVPAGTGCELTLTHENVLADWMTQTEQGWGMIFDGLDTAAQGASANFGSAVEPNTLRLRRLLPGPIERAWAYLTESDKRARWLASGDMPQQVGSSMVLNFDHGSLSKQQDVPPERHQKQCDEFTYTITQCEPPRLLSMTWGGGTPKEPSEVTFELAPQGDKVLLVLTHRRLAARAMMVDVASGWHAHTAILVERLNGMEPVSSFWSLFGRLNEEYDKRLPKE